MGRKGKRERVDRGIYRDARGYEVVACAGGDKHYRRFESIATLTAMQTWRDGEANTMRSEAAPRGRKQQTLADWIAEYTREVKMPTQHPHMPSYRWWAASTWGAMALKEIASNHMVVAFDAMKVEGLSGQTRYYRKLVMQNLWHACYGPTAETPVDAIKVKRKKTRVPVWVPDATIRKVIENLVASEQSGRLIDSRTRARFQVLASCGQRPVQMKRARPADVRFFTDDEELPGIFGCWNVQSAKGGDPIPVYLNMEMAYAWNFFIKAEAWGWYDKRSFARTLRHHGWPNGVRPYDVRHALGITAAEAGVDLADVQSHMGHQDLKTTKGFYTGQRHSRLQRLSRVLEGRFGEELTSAPALPKRVRVRMRKAL